MLTRTTRTSSKVEELVNIDPNKIENSVLKEALQDFQKEQSEKDKKRALENLRKLSSTENTLVSDLRRLRKAEKSAKARLEAFIEAKEQYMKDGDTSAFTDACRKAGYYIALD